MKGLSTAENIPAGQLVAERNGHSTSSSVGVISKVLRILEVLQTSSVGLGLKAICDETGINKSTAHRFLRHLERESYLLRTEAGSYLIGPRLAQMSACASRSATLQAVARPILSDLWRSTQETVNLGVLDQGTVLYVDVMVSQHEFRLVSSVGTRRSLHVAALGKALAAFAQPFRSVRGRLIAYGMTERKRRFRREQPLGVVGFEFSAAKSGGGQGMLNSKFCVLLRSTLVVLALVAIFLTVSASAEEKVQLAADVSKSGAKIDRNIFGQFAEHLGHGIYDGIWVGSDSKIPNTRGIRNDVVAALKAIKVPNVRWPGGCFADEYHWRKGIGPQRGITLNPNWGGVVEPNSFGTHEFMDFMDQIGSEPYVSVNIGSGTPQEAAEWLEYMTADQRTTLAKERAANGQPAPYKIPYLGLGNESWDCGGNMTPDYYLSQMKIYSRFVRNFNPDQQDKNQMLKVAVGPGGDGRRWTDWTEAIMKAYQQHTWSWDMNGLSMHNYTVVRWQDKFASVGFGESEYAQFLQETLKMDALINKHAAIMDKYDPDKKVALVVDEWGSWYAPLPGSNPGFLVQQNSLRDAILAALNLNIFARHADRVRMANIAQMINVLQAMILTDKEKMVLTPTYYVFKMYLPFQDATFVPVTFDAGSYTHDNIILPRVDAIAAKDAKGKLWLEITNLDPNQPVEFEASLGGITAKSAAGETLSAPRVDSVNTFDAPKTVVPKPIAAKVQGGKLTLKLEPKSVTVISVEQQELGLR